MGRRRPDGFGGGDAIGGSFRARRRTGLLGAFLLVAASAAACGPGGAATGSTIGAGGATRDGTDDGPPSEGTGFDGGVTGDAPEAPSPPAAEGGARGPDDDDPRSCYSWPPAARLCLTRDSVVLERVEADGSCTEAGSFRRGEILDVEERSVVVDGACVPPGAEPGENDVCLISADLTATTVHLPASVGSLEKFPRGVVVLPDGRLAATNGLQAVVVDGRGIARESPLVDELAACGVSPGTLRYPWTNATPTCSKVLSSGYCGCWYVCRRLARGDEGSLRIGFCQLCGDPIARRYLVEVELSAASPGCGELGLTWNRTSDVPQMLP
jgi:hypothetical protein